MSVHGAGGLATRNTTRLGGDGPIVDAAAVALATHPGLTAATRPAAVVLVDERDWPAALAASVLAGAPLHAPLLYGEGATLPAASLQALHAMRPTGAKQLGGAQVIAIGVKAPVGYRTRSLTGAGPSAVAGAIARLTGSTTAASGQGSSPGPQSSSPGRQSSSSGQVIVVAEDAPPALSMPAAGLAAETGAPILLVSAAGVPTATATALKALHRPSIYVVGPPTAVSNATLRKLDRFGTVSRIAGTNTVADDPAANAIAVARFSDGSFGWGITEPGHGLVFANAARPLDGPAAASLSASGDYGPLLLLEGPKEIPAALSRYLSDIQPGYTEAPAYRPVRGVYNHGWLIGDELTISTTTQAQLDELLEIAPRTTAATATASTSTSTSISASTSQAEP